MIALKRLAKKIQKEKADYERWRNSPEGKATQLVDFLHDNPIWISLNHEQRSAIAMRMFCVLLESQDRGKK